MREQEKKKGAICILCRRRHRRDGCPAEKVAREDFFQFLMEAKAQRGREDDPYRRGGVFNPITVATLRAEGR